MITAIIQARMGSSRLPGKVLREVLGRPLLSLMLERVRQAKALSQIVVATTTEPQDDAIEQMVRSEGIACFRGSSQDVLDRYYQAAKKFGASTIVRLTADCPLQDPQVIDGIVQRWKGVAGHLDFLSNVQPPTYPDGLDTEVFSFAALQRAWGETTIAEEREHVTPYFYASGKFRTTNVEYSRDLSHHRWTVDYEEDFSLVEKIFTALYKPGNVFGLEEIVAFVEGEGSKYVTNTKYSRNPWFGVYKQKLEEVR